MLGRTGVGWGVACSPGCASSCSGTLSQWADLRACLLICRVELVAGRA